MKSIHFPDEVKLLPETPGVYQYRDKNDAIIYIGKAKNLKARIRSYTALDLLPKTARMVAEARTITYIEVQSEFEALLLEARLVRKYMPLYNIELKDDKSPLYIGITKEEYPRVLTFRQTDLKVQSLYHEFGPYIDGKSAKYVLRLLRKVFPYSQHKVGKRACIYHEIGLCDPCPSVIANTDDPNEKKVLRKKYLNNIKRLTSVLNGKFSQIEKDMTHEMEQDSKLLQYEEAGDLKRKLAYLHAVTSNKPYIEEYVKDPNFVDEVHSRELTDLTNLLNKELAVMGMKEVTPLRRIECFDIAHLAGSNPTASMVTFIDGIPDKNYYRHFKINKGKKQNSDVDSMKEVITRRANHFDDWGKPDLMIIDGGKPQIAAVHEVLGNDFPIVGLAKRYETFVFYNNGAFVEKLLPEGGAKNLVVRLRDEAHRFARRLHHNLVTKTLLGEVQ